MRLLALQARLSVQNETAYRFDFFMRCVSAVINLAGEFFTLWAIFANTRSLAGWRPAEVIVLLGVFRAMVGVIGMVIAPNMRTTMEDVRSGAFDFVLTKPIGAQFYASFRQLVFWRGIDLVLGLALIVGGAASLSTRLTLGALLSFIVTLAAGAVVIYSFWLILATSVFWFTRLANIEMVFWNIFHAGRYPLDVYSPWVRWTLTFILPLGFITTFPAAALVGRGESDVLLASVIVAPLMLLAASAFWRFGVRSYSGASA